MGRPSENDPIDLDPASERALKDEEISKVQTSAEPGMLEQSARIHARRDIERDFPGSELDVDRELPERDEQRNESVEGGEDEPNTDRERDAA